MLYCTPGVVVLYVLYVVCGSMCGVHYVYVYVVEEKRSIGCLLGVENDPMCVRKGQRTKVELKN